MHIISTVAERVGRGKPIYRWPASLTLWEFVHLREKDRIRDLIELGHRIDTAGLTYLAVNDPEKLNAQYQDLELKLGSLPTREEAIAAADQILAQFAEAERRAKHQGRHGQ